MPPTAQPARRYRRPAGLAEMLGLSKDALLVYAMLFCLVVGTAAVGIKGVGAIRPVFIVGSLCVAWRAWKVGPGLHAEVLIYLFALTPFLRRVVDVSAGYNASGIMLLAPMLALGIPATELKHILINRRQSFAVYVPYVLMIACIAYGWSYASFQNRLVESGTETVKMMLPMLYAMYLIQRGDGCAPIVDGLARAFMIVSPIIGIYGIYQWLNPPEWDRYWMIYSQMKSIGLPEARQIRVFGTMNSPGSFAMFAACGLMIFSLCRRGWLPFVLVLPVGIALLLSSIRTAWIVVAVAVAFATMFSSTRQRSVVLTLSLFGAMAAALLLTPAGDIISTRLATLSGDPAQDGSGHARLQQYLYLYSNLDQYLFGVGVGGQLHDPKLEHTDGQFIAAAVQMGIVVGNLYVFCMIWAAVQSLTRIPRRPPPLRVVIAAMVFGELVVLPLITLSSGEVSFLFWMLVGIMTSTPQVSATLDRLRQRPMLPFWA